MTTAARTIVTGAAGFAGGHLIDLLADSAAEVHGWALPGSHPQPRRPDVTWHDVDITQPEAVSRAVRAIAPARIFHLAGAPSVETSWTSAVPHLSINAMGTSHLLDAVSQHAPRCRVLVVTSAQVYRPDNGPLGESTPLAPSSPYGLTKLAQDLIARHAARDEGLDVVVARPFNHIGPRQAPDFAIPNFARQIARIERGLDPPVIRVGNLDTYRDFTDVRDVVDGYCRLMDMAVPGRAYNVCSGSAHRIADLLDALVALSRVQIALELDPARLRPSDTPMIVGDNSRLRSETGWIARIPMATTLRETLEWWRDQIAISA